jgi:DNA polymerase-3 subunit delta'
VAAELRRSVEHGRLPHALMFVGPEGVGKRRFAVALAQTLLCERNALEALEPCGACDACRQVAAGTHPDALIVGRPADKHELPIQAIRDLCHDLSLKPMRGGRRVAIVDDADSLSEEAANAFLKTLEEPPDGSVLILIATAPEMQLDTVVSRCRVVRFEPLAEEDLAAVLLERGVAEDAESAARLARLGEGSVARAEGLADPALGRFRRTLVDALASDATIDAGGLTQEIEAFAKEAGKESAAQRERVRLLAGELARFFRGVIWQAAGLEPPAPDPADRRAGASLAARLEPESVFLLVERCLDADYHVQRRANLGLAIEAWVADLVKWSRPGS